MAARPCPLGIVTGERHVEWVGLRCGGYTERRRASRDPPIRGRGRSPVSVVVRQCAAARVIPGPSCVRRDSTDPPKGGRVGQWPPLLWSTTTTRRGWPLAPGWGKEG